jgi:NADH/NAD ratio-sensing transcriptional regulator Rex
LRRIPDMVITRMAVYSRVLSMLMKKGLDIVSSDELGIKIAIITVPAQFAQELADCLVESGIKAILNFAPTTLRVPEKVILKNADLSLELEVLSFFLTHKKAYDNEFSFLYM